MDYRLHYTKTSRGRKSFGSTLPEKAAKEAGAEIEEAIWKSAHVGSKTIQEMSSSSSSSSSKDKNSTERAELRPAELEKFLQKVVAEPKTPVDSKKEQKDRLEEQLEESQRAKESTSNCIATRSGRIVKPRMASWLGERICYRGDGEPISVSSGFGSNTSFRHTDVVSYFEVDVCTCFERSYVGLTVFHNRHTSASWHYSLVRHSQSTPRPC